MDRTLTFSECLKDGHSNLKFRGKARGFCRANTGVECAAELITAKSSLNDKIPRQEQPQYHIDVYGLVNEQINY